jgi:hypothetical protein
MEVFKINQQLERFELHQDWEGARKLVYDNWISDKNDLEKLLRVGTECWYVITFWDRITTENLFKENFARNLIEAKNHGISVFSSSDQFNWIFGYMINLFPYWFYDFDGDIYKWEKLGKNMIRLACKLNPENAIAKMLSISEKNKEYKKVRQKVSANINQYFPGNTVIECYFRNVLSR